MSWLLILKKNKRKTLYMNFFHPQDNHFIDTLIEDTKRMSKASLDAELQLPPCCRLDVDQKFERFIQDLVPLLCSNSLYVTYDHLSSAQRLRKLDEKNKNLNDLSRHVSSSLYLLRLKIGPFVRYGVFLTTVDSLINYILYRISTANSNVPDFCALSHRIEVCGRNVSVSFLPEDL